MLLCIGLRNSWRPSVEPCISASLSTRRIHYDGRNRLSSFWTPSLRRKAVADGQEDGHDLLVRAGFLQQAHSGIFHLLPLGLRVQNKIERLIDKRMLHLGASKVSLSSISSADLWQRSGRLDTGRDSELFQFQDRRDGKFLLSPTHEEEITTIVANVVHSHKDLPLRLYQVSRKYRDEARPRQGLLRGREFVMKDLYTFDVTEEEAKSTYNDVRQAYSAFLDELKLPYLQASAESGSMGGTLSHEFHFASPSGEDTIITCDKCDFSINEELYVGYPSPGDTVNQDPETINMWAGVSKDRRNAYFAIYPDTGAALNPVAIKKLFPDVDLSVDFSSEVTSAVPGTAKSPLLIVRDPRISPGARPDSQHKGTSQALAYLDKLRTRDDTEDFSSCPAATLDEKPILLTKARPKDSCPQCRRGALHMHRAVEIGHTFHLGTRYSAPLNLSVLNAENQPVHVEMGCHGIGVSRLIGAIAALLADGKGLNWPLAIAPYSVMIVPTGGTPAGDVDALYDQLDDNVEDAVVDDRERPVGWKLNDADLVGYPFIVIMGKSWTERRMVELQCRRLEVKEEVREEDLMNSIAEYSLRL